MAEKSSVMQERAADARGDKLVRYKALVNRALGDSVAKPRLLAEDLGGNLLGWGADFGQRMILAKILVKGPTEPTSDVVDVATGKVTEKGFHQRWDRTSGVISVITGAVGWAGAILTNKSAPLGSARQVARTAATSTLFLGLNRLVSSYVGIPS